jgi:CheY-like chemotaxis protein
MNVKKTTVGRTHEPMRTSGSWAKTQERVLVIADLEEMRELVVKLLSSDGFVVFDQPSAIGATRSIRQNGIRAVVIDIGVPGICGEKVVSVLRENPRLDGLVIILVTGAECDQEIDAKGLESADAILDRMGLEFRLAPLLGRLLRSSNFRPQEAFSGYKS